MFFSQNSVIFSQISGNFSKSKGFFSQSQGVFPKKQGFFPKNRNIFPKVRVFFPDANNVLKHNIMKTDFFPFNNEFFYYMKGQIPVWSSENSGNNLRTANRKHQIDRPYGP